MRMMGRLSRWVTGCALMAMTAAAPAEELTKPEQLVRETTEKVLARVEDNKESLREDSSRISSLVEELILPKFDFDGMSTMVLGVTRRCASDEQIERFQAAYQEQLIHTYGSALAEYSGERLEFLPMHSDPERGRVTVSMRIHPGDSSPVKVGYKLHNRNGPWKVYDVVVEGRSLVLTRKDEVQELVDRRCNGLGDLIERMEKRNAKGEPMDNAAVPTPE